MWFFVLIFLLRLSDPRNFKGKAKSRSRILEPARIDVSVVITGLFRQWEGCWEFDYKEGESSVYSDGRGARYDSKLFLAPATSRGCQFGMRFLPFRRNGLRETWGGRVSSGETDCRLFKRKPVSVAIVIRLTRCVVQDRVNAINWILQIRTTTTTAPEQIRAIYTNLERAEWARWYTNIFWKAWGSTCSIRVYRFFSPFSSFLFRDDREKNRKPPLFLAQKNTFAFVQES